MRWGFLFNPEAIKEQSTMSDQEDKGKSRGFVSRRELFISVVQKASIAFTDESPAEAIGK